MINTLLLIPLSIVCIGIIVYTTYDFFRQRYNTFRWHIRDETRNIVKEEIQHYAKQLEHANNSNDFNPEVKEKFQRLAGITKNKRYDLKFQLQNLVD